MIITAAIIFIVIDFIFIQYNLPRFSKMIKEIQGTPLSPRMPWLLVIYCVVIFQLYYFILRKKRSIFDAFLLGITTYGIFDITNYIIFKKYNLQVLMIDIMWGGILYALTTYLTYSFKSITLT